LNYSKKKIGGKGEGMDIKISSLDMLKVLVHAGIDAIDAKAIIFDLLQYPDGGIEERQKLEEVKRNKLKKRKVKVEPEPEPEEEEDEYEEEDEEEEEEEKSKLNLTNLARPKRVSFKNFGGSSQPLGG